LNYHPRTAVGRRFRSYRLVEGGTLVLSFFGFFVSLR